MDPIRKTLCTLLSAAFLISAFAAVAAGQTIIASVPIATASAGQVGADPALNLIYTAGAAKTGSSMTVINGTTFAVTTTLSPAAGVSADMKYDNIWTGNGSSGSVVVYNSNDVEISSTKVNSCPAAVTFDCRGKMWVASECGTGNDPVWVFDTKTYKLIDGPITPGGTITSAPVVDPDGEILYVTSGGVSREVNPTTYAVTATGFGTVLAVDSAANTLFAVSGDQLQIISGSKQTVTTTVTLTYSPAFIGVNNALGHVYLVNPTGNFIDVYTTHGKKLTTFLFGATSQPNALAVDSVRGRLLVDVFTTSTNSWTLDVVEDLSTVRNCGIVGSCDY